MHAHTHGHTEKNLFILVSELKEGVAAAAAQGKGCNHSNSKICKTMSDGCLATNWVQIEDNDNGHRMRFLFHMHTSIQYSFYGHKSIFPVPEKK